jgi:hypothetical protein
MKGKEVSFVPTVSFRVLSTLVSWVITLLLVSIGGSWLASLPPPGPSSPGPTADRPRVPAPERAEEGPAEALVPEPAEGGEPVAAPPPPAQRLVVAEPLGANLRAEPSTTAPIVLTLPHGALVEEKATEGETTPRGWRRVIWNGRAGWVADELLRPAGAPP